ncbi:MAG: DinB family protein [Chitinophagaceae bacterium]
MARNNLTKEEINKQLRLVSAEFINFISVIDTDKFFYQPKEKWSIAQNVNHLTISANTTRLAFSLPKFVVRLYAGKPNRASRSYDELVNKYKMKLQQGGRASGRFIPKIISAEKGTTHLIEHFTKSMDKLIHTIEQKWADPQLDKYIAPHPLLGKITLREMGYFTIYHTQHHLVIIKERLAENNSRS